MSDGDLGRGRLVHERQVGDVGAHRGVECQNPFIDQAPDGGSGERLGEGADLKQCLWCDRAQRGETGQTEGGVLFAITRQQADGGARHLKLLHRLVQGLGHGKKLG